MAVEIELKAHLDDIDPVKHRLSALGDYSRSYKKSDSYWFPAPETAGELSIPASGIRVRREQSVDAGGTARESALVTYKTKKLSGNIEVNDEFEFTVSNAAVLEDLLTRLRLRSTIGKEKEGWAWIIPSRVGGRAPIMAEISMVKGLGWFAELEIIADNNDEDTIEESRTRLLDLLERLEIPAKRIETKPYSVMLKETQ